MRPRAYVGLSTTYHDTSLAVVDDSGEVLFAEATERFAQSKRGVRIAPDMLHHVAKVMRDFLPAEADIVAAFSWSREQHQRNVEMLAHLEALGGPDPPPEIASPLGRETLARARLSMSSHVAMGVAAGSALEYELSQLGRLEGSSITRRYFDHHAAHAAAACVASPFDDAVCAVIDGFGEYKACAFYHYRDGKLGPPLNTGTRGAAQPGSLGLFYELICRSCGFDSMSGEEWKVMGLASYGKADAGLYRLLRNFLVLDDLDLWEADQSRRFAIIERLAAMRPRAGQSPLEMADVAFAGQRVFSDILYELMRNLHRRGLSGNLVLCGGCALNSSANGGILENTPFESVFVPSAPGDDGNSIGAALLAFAEDHGALPRARAIQSPYLGSRMSGETLGNVRQFGRFQRQTECEDRAPRIAAELLAAGKIIGWIQGRAEFGPRALGNRSILADPRDAGMQERINARVKFREQFRPFAPAILHEHGERYFAHYQASPYMERTLRFLPEAAARVPGVVHHDGTGRLQSVTREWNPRFHALVSAFYDITGVPVLLNTSFNVMGKPIAHSVEDVLAVFCTSGIDAVFIDDLLIEKAE
jgi:carbamoyltransferase